MNNLETGPDRCSPERHSGPFSFSLLRQLRPEHVESIDGRRCGESNRRLRHQGLGDGSLAREIDTRGRRLGSDSMTFRHAEHQAGVRAADDCGRARDVRCADTVPRAGPPSRGFPYSQLREEARRRVDVVDSAIYGLLELLRNPWRSPRWSDVDLEHRRIHTRGENDMIGLDH